MGIFLRQAPASRAARDNRSGLLLLQSGNSNPAWSTALRGLSVEDPFNLSNQRKGMSTQTKERTPESRLQAPTRKAVARVFNSLAGTEVSHG